MEPDDDASPTLDQDRWAQFVAREFSSKWGCTNLHQRELLNNEIVLHEGVGVSLSEDDILKAVSSLKRPHKLDGYKVCPLIFKELAVVRTGSLISILHKICSNADTMRTLLIHGHAAGKRKGIISAQAVRIILPLPCVLAIIDAHLAARLREFIDPLPASVEPGFYETARRKRQILDLTHSLTLVLEKGGDLHGRSVVAQADIKQYYDNLRPLLLFRWLKRRQFDLPTCCLLLRLHCLPTLQVKVGQASCDISGRCFGVLTGTRTAAELGRIPLLDVAEQRMHTWRPLAFSSAGVPCCLGTFVDNLLTTGSDPLSAVAILRDAEQALIQRWRLHFGSDSKQFVAAVGCEQGRDDIDEWKAVLHMRCLGHHLSSTCSIAEDFRQTVKSVWRAYWANASASLRNCSDKAQARFMNSSLRTIAGFRWSRWPYQKSYADRLDCLQRHLISCMQPLVPQPGESQETYARRRRLKASGVARRWGRWSKLWAQDTVSWDSHISRGRDRACWNRSLRDWHGSAWLQAQRFENSSGGSWARTRTRSMPGHPATRWHKGIALAQRVLGSQCPR